MALETLKQSSSSPDYGPPREHETEEEFIKRTGLDRGFTIESPPYRPTSLTPDYGSHSYTELTKPTAKVMKPDTPAQAAKFANAILSPDSGLYSAVALPPNLGGDVVTNTARGNQIINDVEKINNNKESILKVDTSDVSLPVADKKTEEKLAFLGQDNIQNNKEEGENDEDVKKSVKIV